jgi:hypothetical protein
LWNLLIISEKASLHITELFRFLLFLESSQIENNMKKHLIIMLAFLGGTLMGQTQEDAYKTLLKRTSVVVHKAQKQMLATGKTDMNGQLAKAVLLQTHAVKLYGEKSETAAACASSAAREIAAGIILNTGIKDNPYYHLSSEENVLLKNCESDPQLLLKAKSKLPGMALKDSDYTNPQSLNQSNIDFK